MFALVAEHRHFSSKSVARSDFAKFQVILREIASPPNHFQATQIGPANPSVSDKKQRQPLEV
jgi:hypothetical protein